MASAEAPNAAPAASLLGLPWDLRRIILLAVLKPPPRRPEPVFDAEFIRGRVRLRNRFDAGHAETTNIYVERPGPPWSPPRRPPASGLQATSRQLRAEVALLANATLKSDAVRPEHPFVLDLMVVKDVGVFPTWLGFPYGTRRVPCLRVNVRVVRPDDAEAVPVEWVERARYPAGTESTFWSFFAALTLIPLNRVRYGPVVGEAGVGKGSSTPGSISKHRSGVMDAYLVPIEATPYVVDRLLIELKPFEYRPSGTQIIPGIEDRFKKSLFYKEGHIQFGREVFYDPPRAFSYGNYYELHIEMEEAKAREFASEQLGEYIDDSISRIIHEREGDDLALYQYILANSVGEVVDSAPNGHISWISSMDTSKWVSVFESDGDWRTMNISKAIAKEEASESPSRGYIALLQLAKRRRALGWQAQFDKELGIE